MHHCDKYWSLLLIDEAGKRCCASFADRQKTIYRLQGVHLLYLEPHFDCFLVAVGD